MQKNVELINTFFPENKVTVSGNTAKINVSQITKNDLANLNAVATDCNELLLKRSGTGLTVIFTFKK